MKSWCEHPSQSQLAIPQHTKAPITAQPPHRTPYCTLLHMIAVTHAHKPKKKITNTPHGQTLTRVQTLSRLLSLTHTHTHARRLTTQHTFAQYAPHAQNAKAHTHTHTQATAKPARAVRTLFPFHWLIASPPPNP